MSANATTAAPTGRKKLAQGKERSDAALGHESENTSSLEGAKEGGWPILPLSELSADERNSITDGPFGSKLKTEHYTAAGPRVIRLKNIGDGEFVDAKAHISEDHFATLQKHRVFPSDIVIAALGENPPRSCLVPESLGPAVVKADCIRFKAGPRVLPRFLNYVLNGPTLRQHAKGIIHGVGRPRLNLGEIKALPIPVPSIPEQRRIVAEIEKQFTRLEAGVAALRRVQANLKRYRAAVLKVACEGKLVPTEVELHRKQKSKTAKFETGAELLARILTERRQNWQGRGQYKEPAGPDTAKLSPLPDGWTWASPEQLSAAESYSFAIGPFGSNLKVSDYTDSGVPLVFVRNIRASRFGGDGTVFVSKTKAEELRAHSVSGGDVLITKVGAPPGDACLYPDAEPDAVITADCIKLRLSPLLPQKRFFVHTINSEVVKPQLQLITKGVAQMKVSLGRFSTLAIPLPPLAEQTRIVAEVERRLSVVEELESVVTANLQRATRLRQSILQKAFTGELT